MVNEPNNNSETQKIREEERKKFLAEHKHNASLMKQKEKTPFWKWFEEMFLSGRTWKDICMDILNNQLVPEFKDGFRNGLVSLIDMRIYKDHKPGSSSSPSTGTFITNMVDYANVNPKTKAALEANKKKEEEIIKSGYEIPSFRTLANARLFLKDLHTYVNNYYRISVLDLSEMIRSENGSHKNLAYTWDKYGWEKEEILAIKEPKHISNPDHPYIIELPPAHVLAD